jgi:N-acetylglucosaminyltransferase
MDTVPVFLFILVVFANRYVVGLYLKLVKGRDFDVTRRDYEPTVTIVVPLFNEGRSIYDTILSLTELDYPPEKLSVTVVDDCSTDDSYDWASRAAALHPDRVLVLRNPHNMGKRKGINHAVRETDAEIIVSVDSDVLVDRAAVRELVARFTAPDIAAVGGRVHVSNANENWLSRMQTIKYFFGQELLKNLERSMHSVMCLSGCLTAYRRHVLIELEPILENRNVFGVPIKYGEDRFLTRQIVKAGYRTLMTLDAFCYTKAPTTLTGYFNQQLRWKRSNIIDFACGLQHAWKLHPLVGVHYLSMFALLLVYPFLILTHLRDGEFVSLLAFHVELLALLGVVYHLSPSTRKLKPEFRVHPIWFLPMSVLMPTAYLVLTPLGLFTLHSSSWETRGHSSVVAANGGTKP